MAGTVWDDVLARVETKVNRYSYYQWFQHTALLEDRGQTLVIRVADPMVVDWLTKHYAVIINEALAEVGRPGTLLQFHPEGTPAPVAPAPPATPSPEAAFDVDDLPPADNQGLAGLSPRYSF